MTKTRISKCKCGSVHFEAIKEPILVGVCYCDDCLEMQNYHFQTTHQYTKDLQSHFSPN